MATIRREEGFKLPKPIRGSFRFFTPNVGGNGRMYEMNVIKKLFENYQKAEEKKQQKPQKPQPKLKLNPKKERRLIKK